MARGFLVSEYLDDSGTPWRLLVDADYATDPTRGWVSGATPGLPPLPRLWTPRRVAGLDTTGRWCSTRVASLDAPLWTGAATQFSMFGNDGAVYVVTVTRRISERRRLLLP